MASAIIEEVVEECVEEAVENAVEEAVENAVEDAVENAVEDAVEEAVEQVSAQTGADPEAFNEGEGTYTNLNYLQIIKLGYYEKRTPHPSCIYPASFGFSNGRYEREKRTGYLGFLGWFFFYLCYKSNLKIRVQVILWKFKPVMSQELYNSFLLQTSTYKRDFYDNYFWAVVVSDHLKPVHLV